MRKTIIFITVILVFAVSMTELHSVLYSIAPTFSTKKVDLFLSPNFKQQLSIQWYLYIYSNSFLKLALIFLLGMVALKYSRKLFLITVVYFVYFCIDVFMFVWDYQSNYKLYWGLLAASIIAVVIIFIPIKEKAKVISLS